MSWKRIKLKEVLKQYRVQHIVQNETEYQQVSILNNGNVILRGTKIGKDIGRKRQFKIDLKTYPNTLIFTRQLLLQGSIGIASEDVHDCIVTENMPMFSIITSKIDKNFLMLFLKSEIFKSRIRMIELSGSAQKSIHERTFLELEFLIPDFVKQKQIVTNLLKIKGVWGKISTELAHQLDIVKQLRQAFLREAMQGKLSAKWRTENPDIEPASELLKKIKTEKEKLIKEGKLKKDKPLPSIKENEIPFEIPESWEWGRGDLVATFIDPQPSHRTPPESIDNVPYVAMKDINNNGTVDFLSARKEGKNVLNEHQQRYSLRKGDFIFGKIGTIGKPVKLPEPFDYTLSANVILIQAENKLVTSEFLFYFLSSPVTDKILLDKKSTMSYPVFGMAKARMMTIPIPSQQEQQQIVTKLDELMQYCDDLEKSIKTSRQQNEMLLQQVLREALEPNLKIAQDV